MSARFRGRFVVALLGWLLGVGSTASADPVFTVQHQFALGTRVTSLIQGADGHFYGTTENAVFKLTPAAAVTVLHTFTGGADGALTSSLMQATDGNFYGTTRAGGISSSCQSLQSGCGTVFKMTPDGALTTLHAFLGGAADGASPEAALIQATDGNFYGTTSLGGSTNICGGGFSLYGCGTIFKMTPDGTVTLLHKFIGGVTDGANAAGQAPALLQMPDGNFYGTTTSGGSNATCSSNVFPPGCGTAFKMTPEGSFTILHAFAGGVTDGRNPNALIQGSDGNLYGTTTGGGSACSQCGTVFKMTASGAVTIVHAFAGGPTDGSLAHDDLMQASDGNFYGTTRQGGESGLGTVFKMTPAGIVTLLYSQNEHTGTWFKGTLIQAVGGFVYGGVSNVVFRLVVPNPPASDDLVVDFGPFGVWALLDNAAEWGQLHTAAAKNIVTGDLDGNGIDEIVVDFGSQFGLWVYANKSEWYQLHPSTATRMVTGDLDGSGRADVLIDFPGFGLWVWFDNTSWSQLHPSNSNNVVVADLDGNSKDEAIVDFPGFGLWVWRNNTSWQQLHPASARLMTAGDFDGNGQADLVVDFAGFGLWTYSNSSTWSQTHPFSTSHLAAGDTDGNGKDELIVDFGPAYGIWTLLNSTTWSQIHALASMNMVTADLDDNGKADVIVNFGALGLWEYANNKTWFQLHTVSPGAFAAGDINAP